MPYGTSQLREAWSSLHQELAKATRPIRNFLPQTCPPTPRHRLEGGEDLPILPSEQVPKELVCLWLCRAPGKEIKDFLFLPWVGVSLALPTLLSLRPRVPPPGCLCLPFPLRAGVHMEAVQPRPPGSGAHTRTRTYACIQMSTACCPSEVLLLLRSVRLDAQSAPQTELPTGNRGPCSTEGRLDCTEGSASGQGSAGR